MGSRIGDSAAAVHEAAATLGFTLKKARNAFTQGHDVFVALPTGFGTASVAVVCRTFLTNFEVSPTHLLLWW